MPHTGQPLAIELLIAVAVGLSDVTYKYNAAYTTLEILVTHCPQRGGPKRPMALGLYTCFSVLLVAAWGISWGYIGFAAISSGLPVFLFPVALIIINSIWYSILIIINSSRNTLSSCMIRVLAQRNIISTGAWHAYMGSGQLMGLWIVWANSGHATPAS